MTIKVFAGISLRTPDGIRFGTLLRIRAALMGIETDGRLEEGDQVEFQLDLVGFDAVVQGIGEIHRAEHRDDALDRYLLRILRMRRADQALLQEWHEQLAQGLVPSLQGDDEGGRALDSNVVSGLPEDLGLPRPPPPAGGTPAQGRAHAAIKGLLVGAGERAAPAADPVDAPDVDPPARIDPHRAP